MNMTAPLVATLLAIASIIAAIYIPPAHRGYVKIKIERDRKNIK